jgi:26S proteasome regulatory subunit N9
MDPLLNSSLSVKAKDIVKCFPALHEQKLWHQLTLKLNEFFQLKETIPFQMNLFNDFISKFSDKIAPLSLAVFASMSSVTLPPQDGIAFLSKFIKEDQEANAYLNIKIGHYHLLLGQLDQVKDLSTKTEKMLNEKSMDASIHAGYYRLMADYFKAKNSYPQYYHNALLYLSSVPLESLPLEEKQERAYELAISALLGEGLYNFGKLLLHPVLDSLAGTEYDWLRNFLFQLNNGDMDGFDKTLKSKEFHKQNLLVSAQNFLRQKLCLMTLVEIIFKRSKESRGHMSFSEIASETRIPLDEVEHLVMKAQSLGLVKGYIDQVDSMILVI